MIDWYEENIEEEVRPIVKLLRDNGFNTTCSCGHKMYIECALSPDGEIKRLYDLIWIFCNEAKLDFKLTYFIETDDGHPHWGVNIKFKERLKRKTP